jgi:hypothetical protein
MAFSNDIFISYAHIDNEPFGDPKGWVDNLFERLRIRLAQLLGRQAEIWWDARLQGNDYFVGEIGDRISGSRLLVSVVTPRYVQSNWCRGELQEFYRRAERGGGLQVKNLSRVLQVVKTPVADDQHPDELRGMSGYLFYEFDAGGTLREFRQEMSPNKDQRYWDKLDDLAWDIKRTLEGFAEEQATANQIASPLSLNDLPLARKVYLAEVSGDLSAERDRIRRELLQRDFYVLPDRELPRSAAELQSLTREYLSNCFLSIHLLGASYGFVPDGEDERSAVRLQEELAAERAKGDASFMRLIWTPADLEIPSQRQRQYLAELQSMLGAGADFLQCSVEDLKTRLLEKLAPQKQAESVAATSNSGDDLTRVYLMCDNRDLDDVMPIEDYLFNEGYEVLTPAGGGEGAQAAQYHRDSLVNCDAALIYYGHADMPWLRTKLWDLQKAPGWGRTKPMLARGIYVSSPATSEKQRFRTREVPLVMQNFSEFSPDALQPFVSAVGAGERGQG